MENSITIYTIIHAASSAENGMVICSTARGSYLSLAAARRELKKQITAERKLIPEDYDCEESGEDFWEVYQDGFAAAAYSRLEIVPAMLYDERMV
ncbi:MAG: hypothetical protein IKC03_05160 [Oscillospiraceae bacterium]|nr:hypothetical protein [Oscillospiraceae bacterium]